MTMNQSLAGTMNQAKALKFHKAASIKIGTINDADLLFHSLDLSAYVPTNAVAVAIFALKTSGTGWIWFYSENDSGAVAVGGSMAIQRTAQVLGLSTDWKIGYKQGTASDVYDVQMIGYFTEE